MMLISTSVLKERMEVAEGATKQDEKLFLTFFFPNDELFDFFFSKVRFCFKFLRTVVGLEKSKITLREAIHNT